MYVCMYVCMCMIYTYCNNYVYIYIYKYMCIHICIYDDCMDILYTVSDMWTFHRLASRQGFAEEGNALIGCSAESGFEGLRGWTVDDRNRTLCTKSLAVMVIWGHA